VPGNPCFYCRAPADGACVTCGRFYCRQHGQGSCVDCYDRLRVAFGFVGFVALGGAVFLVVMEYNLRDLHRMPELTVAVMILVLIMVVAGFSFFWRAFRKFPPA
jgi:hypothetical protein